MSSSKKIGFIIKYFQEKNSFSHKSIYESVCSKSQYFRIIKGETNPSIYLLQQFSKKINVNLFSYIDYLDYNNPISAYNFFEKCYLYYCNYEFKKLYLLCLNSKLNHKNSSKYKLFIWYKSISTANYFNITSEYINQYYILKNLITKNNSDNISKSISHLSTSTDFDIINSMAVFQFKLGNFNLAIEILDCTLIYIENFLDSPFFNIFTYNKILFNLSKYNYKIRNYQKSIKLCNKGISLCINKKHYESLGSFYYQNSLNYKKISNYSSAQYNYNKFINFFDSIGKSEFIKKFKINI